MLSPPKIKEQFGCDSLVSDGDGEIHEEELPCSPHSHPTPHRMLFQMFAEGLQLIEGKQYLAGVRKLEQLTRKINVNRNMPGNSIKSGSIRDYWKLQFCVLYHLGYAYSLSQNNQLLFSTCDKMIKMMQRIEKFYVEPFLKNSYRDIQDKIPLICTDSCSIKNNLNFYVLYVRFLLFSCFKHSKAQKYSQAYTFAREAQKILSKIFSCLVSNDYFYTTENQQNQKIQFKQVIVNKAQPILIKILHQFDVQRVEDSISLKMIRSAVGSWRKNPEQGKTDIKMSTTLPLQSKIDDNRSILGVKAIGNSKNAGNPCGNPQKVNHSITQIIKLEPVNLKNLCRANNLTFQISEQKLRQKIELLCCAYFCLGTQIQNLQYQNINLLKTMPASARSTFQNILEKDNLTLHDCFWKSQMYFLKAIEVTVSYLRDSDKLLDNLVNVYHRKFEGELVPITEQNSKYEISGSVSELEMSNKKNNSNKNSRYNQDLSQILPEQVYYRMDKKACTEKRGRRTKSQKKFTSISFVKSKKLLFDNSKTSKQKTKASNRANMSTSFCQSSTKAKKKLQKNSAKVQQTDYSSKLPEPKSEEEANSFDFSNRLSVLVQKYWSNGHLPNNSSAEPKTKETSSRSKTKIKSGISLNKWGCRTKTSNSKCPYEK